MLGKTIQMEKQLRRICVFLCFAMIRTSLSVTSEKLENGIINMNRNLANVCNCLGKGLSVLELSCDFANEIYEFRITSNVTSVIFTGKQSMAALEYITKSASNKYIKNIDVNSNTAEITITKEFLSRFPHLGYIRLNNCNITQIEKGAFSILRFITSIDLSENSNLKLNSVTEGLEGLNAPYLKTLNLSGIHNAHAISMGRLDEFFFKYLSKSQLESLDLSWTRLHYVAGSFSHLTQLKTINSSWGI